VVARIAQVAETEIPVLEVQLVQMEAGREDQDEMTEIVIVITETAAVMIGMIDAGPTETIETTETEDGMHRVDEAALDHHRNLGARLRRLGSNHRN